MKKILSLLTLCALLSGNVNISKCSVCHGKQFEKKAFGVSKIVKDMNSTEIYSTLVSFQNGTRKDKLSGLMKGQISSYSKKDLKYIANRIVLDSNVSNASNASNK